MTLKILESRIDYCFNNKLLLEKALTHRSYGPCHNERLEFLGDSILNFVISDALFKRFPESNEGELSRLRANLVRQSSLVDIAQGIGLSSHLRLGDGELKSGGSYRSSILANTVEALFGAVFLDSRFKKARDVILGIYEPFLESTISKTLIKDSKTLLQEYLQKRKLSLPSYTVVSAYGLAHAQQFEVRCDVSSLKVSTLGKGTTKRSAEQTAADLLLQAL